MQCPESVAEILAQILKCGILQARAAAWSGDAELCAALTDHIHNLPDLLADFSEERLTFYWDVERPTFVRSVAADASSPYTVFWDELRTHCNLIETAETNG